MIIDLRTIKKVYINVDKDYIKRVQIEEYLENLKYSNVERFPGVLLKKQKNCFNVGCSTSHNMAMKKHEFDLPLLLLEDDCKPTQWYGEYVNGGLIEIPDDADVVYLGYSMAGHDTWFKAKSINEKWMHLNSCMATHSILFLNDKIKQFINNSDKTIQQKEALDIGYARDVLSTLKVYAPKKVLFYQANGCVITTHVIVQPELNKWQSYNHDGTLNFDRQIIYDNDVNFGQKR